MNLMIKNATVFTNDPSTGIIRKGYVGIDSNLIAFVSEHEIPAGKSEVFDAGGRLLMPGFVNAHGHLYSSLARGIAVKEPFPENFKEILESLWWKLDNCLDREEIYCSALIGAIDSVRCGTTTVFDHHSSQSCISGSLDLVASAAEKIGMRACLCFEVSDRNGRQAAKAGIEENARFARGIRDRCLITSSFGLHASFTLSDETLNLARKSEWESGAGFHIHAAEDQSDLIHAQSLGYNGVIHRLDRLKILTDNTILAHCIHISKKEMDIIADRGCFVAHNPQSNFNNAVGMADVQEMLARNINVCLGTDGFGPHMINEVRQSVFTMKQVRKNPSAGFSEAQKIMFGNNYLLASQKYGRPIGIIKKGALADLIIVDYIPPTPMNEANFMGHFLSGIGYSSISDVIIDGKFVLKHGKITAFDEEEIRNQAVRKTESLWKKFSL
jgi:putative selenium metabolism protein SsnA